MKLTDKSVMLLALLTLNLCFAMVYLSILSISRIGVFMATIYTLWYGACVCLNIRTIILCLLKQQPLPNQK